MSIYGYARISTAKQSIERQIRNIEREYPSVVIVQEAYTGTKFDRKEWGKLFGKVREGDTIVFDSVSRMSRNAEDGFAVYEELFNVFFSVAENTRGLKFFQHDRRAVHIDLQGVLLLDIQCTAQFDGQYDAAQFVHLSDNASGFHKMPPFDLFQIRADMSARPHFLSLLF